MTAIGLEPSARRARQVLHLPVAALLGVATLAVFLWITGVDVPLALGALWRGAFGSWYVFTSATLVRATPLIVLGLAFAIGARGGALNIGMEGQFAAGAMGAAAVATWIPVDSAPLAVALLLLASLLAGALWIAVPAILRARFAVSEVITTLLLNFVASALVSYAITGPLQERSRQYPQSATLDAMWRLPHLGRVTRLHLGFVIALLLAAVVGVVLARTRWGFQLRAVGASPRAAAISGRMDVGRIAAAALLLSGALAGLGGGIEVSGVSYALYQNLSPGYGFTAIAVALLARMRPELVVVTGILFGALDAGAGAMQRDAGVPSVAALVVEAVVIVTMLLTARKSP